MYLAGKLQAILYGRFSKEEKQRHQSIEAQRLFCEQYLRSLGIDAEIIFIYDEDSLSNCEAALGSIEFAN